MLYLAHDAAADLIQQLIGQAGPRSGHEVLRLHRPQGQRIVVGALVTHDTHAADAGQHGKVLTGGTVQSRQSHLLPEDGIGIPQDLQFLIGDLTDDTDGQTGAGEGLAPHQLLRQAQLDAQLPHLVLEQPP